MRKNIFELKELPIGDVEFGGNGSENEEGEEQETEVVMGAGIKLVLYQGDANRMTDDKCSLVYLLPSLTLAQKTIPKSCRLKECGRTLAVKHITFESTLYLKWVSLTRREM